jgi:peptidoglycan glycosyltransferase
MKVVTSAALLRIAPSAAQRTCRFIGSPYYLAQNLLDPPSRGRTASFVDALAMSNNQCFAQLAVHEIGSLGVIDQMESFGLLEPPGPGHQPGEVDPVHDRLQLGKLGSGLAGSRISPLAAARMAAALVDGQVVTPRWIARVRDANGVDLQVPASPAPRSVLSAAVTNELRSMMVQTTVRGTARRAFHARDGSMLLDPVPVAGKTGSLNGVNPDGHYEWFIGVAPANDPTIAVATLVVNRGKWRRSASQVAAQVLQAVFCEAGACRAEAPAQRRTAGRRDEGGDRG